VSALRPSIVVVTPTRNEGPNLPRFLAVTSEFADHIVIEDQCSSDDSVAICKRFGKVTLIENPSPVYDEAGRQRRLLQKARELVGGPRIILALDADEILAGDALGSRGWQAMLEAKPGTVLLFEKPDLYEVPERCIRYATPWPLGFVDDGSEHRARRIHSIRVPSPPHAAHLVVDEVKILHYAMLRLDFQASKQRMYCAFENVHRTAAFWRRRLAYPRSTDWTRSGRLETTPERWFERWERAGIDMRTVPRQRYYWSDYEVLRLFHEHGARRFWLDEIWDFDWEACRAAALEAGVEGVPWRAIVGPPPALAAGLRRLDRCMLALRAGRRRAAAWARA
jgi:glycosyltransferase involved in cell wall biosynthesis